MKHLIHTSAGASGDMTTALLLDRTQTSSSLTRGWSLWDAT